MNFKTSTSLLSSRREWSDFGDATPFGSAIPAILSVRWWIRIRRCSASPMLRHTMISISASSCSATSMRHPRSSGDGRSTRRLTRTARLPRLLATSGHWQ
uniref:Uncharacterized protein n=1 Tax=Siphoviridae sp. ctrpM6 TaxID=2827956 RepID=A0A8S5T443_9CAUD|nr:MAG TPA: hypothetical protein [Siphoviridae sp. ctrpM6]